MPSARFAAQSISCDRGDVAGAVCALHAARVSSSIGDKTPENTGDFSNCHAESLFSAGIRVA
jgi:hypothetical protein